MNRLVIVGNGFDLAHGLPTSYKDFIGDYWEKVLNELLNKHIYRDSLCALDISRITNDFKAQEVLRNTVNDFKTLSLFISNYQKYCSQEFTNNFFLIISNQINIENWLDIENEYYKLLKECVKQNDNFRIIKLNKEFEQVKGLLEKYLVEKVEEKYYFSEDVVKEFMNIFNVSRCENFELDRFFMELSKQAEKFLIKEHKEYLNKNKPHNGYLPSDDISHKVDFDYHFLSFNYTSTVFNYIKALDINLYNLNEIHGRLEDERNLINFGFGDEMDKHYQEIEEKDDNEYLKNIKSFQYLHTSNYKRLLDLIDSDKFQVYIMGHSCGLSDRTLLNTIFEHENCCSIKVFYHEILNTDGEVVNDNYTEITQNISRHFNKKSLMREKIVNKTLCQPLPQVKLPLYREKTAPISESRL
ncbi:AbiH family protein [Flavobacterium maritimum]|uniref:AbiH family protein n=1 Tax=Flavobacterium maritimum TaxID=3149042 RepID=UPI0032B54EE6